ncbi:hypothetical protein GIB67_039525 [Kingdonia uniflora]|uniref:RING-type domain-containing protein n=1 Tax=Kingdonia uniflora TaxID=39325 RepID=A0A7J7LIQ7_9MAGN|nr:hypothetical protein GIB67_039525 [Kingdonia uniflora]
MSTTDAMGSCTQLPSVSGQEKSSRNKRKFWADLPLGDLSKLSNECSSYEFSAEKTQNGQVHEEYSLCDVCSCNQNRPDSSKHDHMLSGFMESFKVEPTRPREVTLESEDFQDADWSDLTESQLEELCLNNLDTIFKSAIKKISACEYSEEIATKAVLRTGLYYGCKDTLSNVVDNTLVFLKNGEELDRSRDHFFENLVLLEKYILAEMVCVLREVRPFFNTGDAMWCLLICDMNVSHACAMEGEPLSIEVAGDSLSMSTTAQLKPNTKSSEETRPNTDKPNPLGIPSLPSPRSSLVIDELLQEKERPVSSSDNVQKAFSIIEERVHVTLQASGPGGRKGHSVSAKRETILRQKSFHLEKGHRGGLRTGKLSSLGGLIFDKKLKSVSDSISINPKNVSLKVRRAVGVEANQGGAGGKHNISSNDRLSTPAASVSKSANAPSIKPTAKKVLSPTLSSKNATASNMVTSNCNFSGIPYDNALGKWVPNDEKDEMILKLVPRVRELQNQLQEWSEWANQKVMQAARRLGKDKTELKTLRQEKEEVARLKKEKQALEDNTVKKLSEMESALDKAASQVERANATVIRLEGENSKLRQDMEEAKSRAAKSAASCEEVSEREKKMLSKFQSWERQKSMFQEELASEKRKLAQLQQEVEQVKDFHDQLEARRKQEEKLKEEVLMQANSIKKEREQTEVSAKSKENMLRLKAENDLQRCKDDIRNLESKIAHLRLKTDSSKIAALQWGNDVSYINSLSDDKTVNALLTMGESTDVKRERECVMCLTEEMSVVFLPCAHQVVCTKCNELHEKQGMDDCPSCRTPIQRRICVRYSQS